MHLEQRRVHCGLLQVGGGVVVRERGKSSNLQVKACACNQSNAFAVQRRAQRRVSEQAIDTEFHA
jgi:hypothetical protein